jgi:hypothetical protein
MKVKNLFFVAAAIAVCLAFSQVASASLYLTPGGAGLETGNDAANALGEVLTGNETGQPQINAAIAGTLGGSTELYKQDVGQSDVGTFASSYTTVFSNSNGNFTITYDGVPDPVITNATHLLVKDGNQVPSWYLFDIAGLWDGTEIVLGLNFWPGNGAISHVTIYGGGPGTQPVPEPVALVVWSLLIGSVGLATARRRHTG